MTDVNHPGYPKAPPFTDLTFEHVAPVFPHLPNTLRRVNVSGNLNGVTFVWHGLTAGALHRVFEDRCGGGYIFTTDDIQAEKIAAVGKRYVFLGTIDVPEAEAAVAREEAADIQSAVVRREHEGFLAESAELDGERYEDEDEDGMTGSTAEEHVKFLAASSRRAYIRAVEELINATIELRDAAWPELEAARTRADAAIAVLKALGVP